MFTQLRDMLQQKRITFSASLEIALKAVRNLGGTDPPANAKALRGGAG